MFLMMGNAVSLMYFWEERDRNVGSGSFPLGEIVRMESGIVDVRNLENVGNKLLERRWGWLGTCRCQVQN
jgi:hypothetical protein